MSRLSMWPTISLVGLSFSDLLAFGCLKVSSSVLDAPARETSFMSWAPFLSALVFSAVWFLMVRHGAFRPRAMVRFVLAALFTLSVARGLAYQWLSTVPLDTGRVVFTDEKLAEIRVALQEYRQSHGHFPAHLVDLALPEGEAEDGWGAPFQYESKLHGTRVIVFSTIACRALAQMERPDLKCSVLVDAPILVPTSPDN